MQREDGFLTLLWTSHRTSTVTWGYRSNTASLPGTEWYHWIKRSKTAISRQDFTTEGQAPRPTGNCSFLSQTTHGCMLPASPVQGQQPCRRLCWGTQGHSPQCSKPRLHQMMSYPCQPWGQIFQKETFLLDKCFLPGQTTPPYDTLRKARLQTGWRWPWWCGPVFLRGSHPSTSLEARTWSNQQIL